MGAIRDLSEQLFSGAVSTFERHPFAPLLAIEEVAPRAAFVSSFANATAIDTGDGLVLIDTGSFLFAGNVKELVRGWTQAPLHTAVYTHGHVDHVFGVGAYEQVTGGAKVVAHEAVPARFDRYKKTQGYNACINARQFQVPPFFPGDFRYPDTTFARRLDLQVGGTTIELHHARGETDDHTWAWLPERKLLCTGDLFIWACPNAGNPQKVQRYPGEWAAALREMAALPAETMCPGHGPPIFGHARIRAALSETAEVLESLVEQTIARMNEGARLDDVLASVKPPRELLDRPYLRPIYDEPEFIVRNVWRLYGGWWDGNPATLKPAREAEVAAEIASMVPGGAAAVAARAKELAARGDLALATHLAELAALAAPEDDQVRAARAAVLTQRAGHETSLMAKGIFASAAADPPKRRG